MSWYVYMVRCNDDTLYTGTTTDIKNRLKQHNSGKRGAKYTKSRRPVCLVFAERSCCRSAALKREYHIRNLSLAQKLRLISGNLNPLQQTNMKP